MEKNQFPNHGKFRRLLAVITCRILGHSWVYKNYGLTWKEVGRLYEYKYSRRCQRCNLRHILKRDETGWEESDENPDATL